MESTQHKTNLAGGSLEAWQPDALAARLGDRLFRVTKPFFSGGTPLLPLNEGLCVCSAGQSAREGCHASFCAPKRADTPCCKDCVGAGHRKSPAWELNLPIHLHCLQAAPTCGWQTIWPTAGSSTMRSHCTSLMREFDTNCRLKLGPRSLTSSHAQCACHASTAQTIAALAAAAGCQIPCSPSMLLARGLALHCGEVACELLGTPQKPLASNRSTHPPPLYSTLQPLWGGGARAAGHVSSAARVSARPVCLPGVPTGGLPVSVWCSCVQPVCVCACVCVEDVLHFTSVPHALLCCLM